MASKAKHVKAAERALGLEPLGRETDAEAELRLHWERRFAPLGLALPEAEPPEDMYLRIQRSIDRTDDVKSLQQARRSRNRWRWATIGATALAASLAFVAVAPMLEPPPPIEAPSPAPRYVAVVTPEGAKESLIVEVDLEAGTAVVRPIGVSVEQGKTLELWRIAPDSDPESVGLIPADGVERLDVSANPGDTFAVSLEPEGGSATGAPTGPVLYSGALVAVPE